MAGQLDAAEIEDAPDPRMVGRAPSITRVSVPVFVRVVVSRPLVVFTTWLPKASVVGVNVGAGGLMPVPVSATDGVNSMDGAPE